MPEVTKLNPDAGSGTNNPSGFFQVVYGGKKSDATSLRQDEVEAFPVPAY
jgi:hypothetical protein